MTCSTHGWNHKFIQTHKTWRRLLNGPRRRWWYDSRIDLKQIGCESLDWIQMAQDRVKWRNLVNTAMAFLFHKTWDFLDHLCEYPSSCTPMPRCTYVPKCSADYYALWCETARFPQVLLIYHHYKPRQIRLQPSRCFLHLLPGHYGFRCPSGLHSAPALVFCMCAVYGCLQR